MRDFNLLSLEMIPNKSSNDALCVWLLGSTLAAFPAYIPAYLICGHVEFIFIIETADVHNICPNKITGRLSKLLPGNQRSP